MVETTARTLCLLVSTFFLAAFSAQAAPYVFAVPNSLKVRPSLAAQEDQGIALTAARNEFVSFQVVIQGGAVGAKSVTASLNDLTGPSTISTTRMVIYREALINITTPSGGVGDTGLWPDGLVPDVDEMASEKRNAFPFDVPANQARALWVDIHIPHDAPAGTYGGHVSVSGTGFSAQVPVHLVVMNATLPSTPTLTSAFLIFGGNVCQAMTGTSDCGSVQSMSDQVSRFATLALDHRVTLCNIFVIGRPGNDWPSFDAAYAPFLDGKASTRLTGARMTTAQLVAKRDMSVYTLWGQHFREKGWFDRLFDYTGDEPPYGISFDTLKTNLLAVRATDPLMRTLVTTTITAADKYGLTGLIDILVPVVNFLDGTTAPYVGDQRAKYNSFLAEAGNQLWSYQSCMSQGCAYGVTLPENTPGSGWPSYMIDRSAAKNRAMQWLMYKYQVPGELYFETAQYLPTAWTTQHSNTGNGDGTLFYPGTVSMIGGKTAVPLPSIRLKQIRQGMQDYEWLNLVANAGDPPFAQQVVDELLPSAHNVPDDGNLFDQARMKLIQRYAELTATPSNPADGGVPGVSSDAGSTNSGNGGKIPIISTRVTTSCSSSGTAALPLLSIAVLWILGRRARLPASRRRQRLNSSL